MMGFAFPSLVAGILWGDWVGGFFYAGVARLVLVHHATFLVNSLAHFWGTASYADDHTPRDSILTAVLTFGEGYHNFHHEFPHDYRNAVKFYQYDPTKWFIKLMSCLGLAYELKKFPENEIRKGRLQMRQKVLDRMKEKVHWGNAPEELPLITPDVLSDLIAEGNKLVIIGGLVHDVSQFSVDHPGGRALLETYIGKDATTQFNGGVYNHSNAARNLLSQMRVGRASPDACCSTSANVSSSPSPHSSSFGKKTE